MGVFENAAKSYPKTSPLVNLNCHAWCAYTARAIVCGEWTGSVGSCRATAFGRSRQWILSEPYYCG
jgi:hypothetical protein